MSRRTSTAAIVSPIVAVAAIVGFALPGHPTAAAQPAVHRSEGLPPMPALHPTVVQPAVGVGTGEPAPAAPAEQRPAKDPVPTRAATQGDRPAHADGRLGGSVTHARALPNGVAVPPLEAPQAVREII
jgi:hypothetical protein